MIQRKRFLRTFTTETSDYLDMYFHNITRIGKEMKRKTQRKGWEEESVRGRN